MPPSSQESVGLRSEATPSQIIILFELVLLVLLAVLWGSSYLFIKIAVVEIPPITLIAARVSIAASILLAILCWRDEKLPRDWISWFQFFIQSFLNATGAWTILAWGQQYIDTGLASVLNSLSPVFVLFITLTFTRHEHITVLKLAGAALGISGVILIVGVEALNGFGQQVAGQLAALLAAFLYGCAAVNGRRFSHLPATVTTAGVMVSASICLVPLSLLVDEPWTLDPSIEAILAAVALASFCTAAALLIYFRLVKTLGSMGVASQSYLRVGVGVILGVFVLGEQMDLVIWLGIILVVLGVIAINSKPRKPAT